MFIGKNMNSRSSSLFHFILCYLFIVINNLTTTLANLTECIFPHVKKADSSSETPKAHMNRINERLT